MKILINQESKLHSGSRKRVYLFIIDEEKANHKRVVTEKEIALMNLKPDFIANGQLRHCALESMVFWLNTNIFTWRELTRLWFFFDPATVKDTKNSAVEVIKYIEEIEKTKIPIIQ